MRRPLLSSELFVATVAFLLFAHYFALSGKVLFMGLVWIWIGVCAWNLYRPEGREIEDPEHFHSTWKIRLFASLPWNLITRVIGLLRDLPVHPRLREPIYGWYVRRFGCDMSEAEEQDLKAYPTFAAFFNRRLKAGVRPIDEKAPVVSPCDGTVLHYGKIQNGRIKYVKARDFDIHDFLGPTQIQTKEGNALFQVVIFLSPGDYHAFHSPAEWHVEKKTHFPGLLFPVASYSYWRPKLLCLNERVILSGNWKHGFFSMSPIAAPYVGGIMIRNEPVKFEKLEQFEHFVQHELLLDLKPGDPVGEFHFGSTMVLIFEAPEDIEFDIKAGQKLNYGQAIVELMQNRIPGDITKYEPPAG